MSLFLKLSRLAFIGFFAVSIVAAILLLGVYVRFATSLPDAATLREVKLQVPLKVYSYEGKLVAAYGEKRRIPLKYDEFPQTVVQAFLAAEDDRFFHHPGVDCQGIVRAVLQLIRTGEKKQGGSTITMQLARNFFLGNERTYERKLKEIILALRIEREFSKNEILQLYLNKIYLGSRAYGVGAAAEVYFGKTVAQLSLPEIAMIAGLPKAPSADNPIANPERAMARRNYVLGRMHVLNYIDQPTYDSALAATIVASLHLPQAELDASYVGEMVRQEMVNKYGEAAYTEGFHVYTTIRESLQIAANHALRQGLIEYDQRHGFRGAEAKISADILANKEMLDVALQKYPAINGLIAGVVMAANDEGASVYIGKDQTIILDRAGIQWAHKFIDENSVAKLPQSVAEILQLGDLVRVVQNDNQTWSLSQIPLVAGSVVSLNPTNGEIVSLVGGFDFALSKFNRATQAQRQPGSSFKPFIYSAALEAGFTPASIINDAPIVFEDVALEDTWRPRNFTGKFYGPTRLRDALANSRNMVSIRLLNSIGRKFAVEHIQKFGFDVQWLPQDLTLALGSGAMTPLALASGYSVFANGGFRVEPYFIDRIESAAGEILFQTDPTIACEGDCLELYDMLQKHEDEIKEIEESTSDGKPKSSVRFAPRVISASNAYQMVSMMHDVIEYGTAKKARELGRTDLAGKTGTTNEQRDAWFVGFNQDLVAVAWVGFDQHQSLGKREVGGVAALPIWMKFTASALKGRPLRSMPMPEGMVTLRIDPKTGTVLDPGSKAGVEEVFREDYVPTLSEHNQGTTAVEQSGDQTSIPEQLF